VSLLLDTHVFLWWIGEPSRLPGEVTAAIADPGTLVYVSAASAWEISIKRALGRLDLRDEEFRHGMQESGFTELPVTAAHGLAAGALPQHHRDPFDRMLVAQAAIEGMRLVTHERAMARYGAEVVWV
jgi:PIN domain nuclease of toxin-antitoxin system